MIPYIGDLSRADATLLAHLARDAGNILEFGVGASTQLFAAYGAQRVTSVDTSAEWIAKTKRNLAMLGIERPVRFVLYDEFEPVERFDLVFVDGLNELRLPFAFRTWSALAPGGRMAFHDTRRSEAHGAAETSDVSNVCSVAQLHWLEIRRIDVNRWRSNTTVITKRVPLVLENWNRTEGRTPEQIGIA